jgi:hypothetical protein
MLWLLGKLCTMPNRNYPNDIAFDFIKKRYGDMITSHQKVPAIFPLLRAASSPC